VAQAIAMATKLTFAECLPILVAPARCCRVLVQRLLADGVPYLDALIEPGGPRPEPPHLDSVMAALPAVLGLRLRVGRPISTHGLSGTTRSGQ
jgi:hypothetical protein